MKPGTILDSRGNAMQRRGYAPGGYLGAGHSRTRSMLPGMVTDSARELTSYTRHELLRKTRVFKKNVGMVRGVAKSLVDHAIGPGVFPLPATSDDAWNEAAFKWLWELAKICETSGTMTLWETQRARTAAKFWDGEMFTLHLKGKRGWPQYQLIRGHNCGSYEVHEEDGWTDGVKLDADSTRLAYRFRLRGDRYQTIPAKSVVHSYLLEDTDVVRGVTPLAHALNNLHDILDSLSLEKAAIKDLSRTSRVIQTESGEDEDDEPVKRFGVGGDEDDDDDDNFTHRLEELFGVEIARLKTGEKLESFRPDRPSPTFTGFLDYVGKDVTTGTGFPYEFAWAPNDLKGPAARFVLEKVRLAVDEWRRNECEDTYPFVTLALAHAIQTRELPPNPEFGLVEWIGGSPDVTIDKGRDAAQDRENLKAALTNFKRYYAAQGLWWKTELRQKAIEAGYIDQLAKEFSVSPDRIHLLLINAAAQPSEPGKVNGRDREDEEDDEEEKEEKRARR